MLRQTILISILFFLGYKLSGQDWSYDTIPDKNIKKVSIFRLKFQNGNPTKDSILKCIRYYHKGLKTHEIYFGNCKDRACNDSMWYYYNDHKLLSKVIDAEGIGEKHTTTILFSYDYQNNNTKRVFLDEKNEIRQTISFTRFFDDKKRLQLLVDTTIGRHSGLTVSRTKYFYNDKNKMIKTMYYYRDTLHGQENMSAFDNPNKKYKTGLDGSTNLDIKERSGLQTQSIYFNSAEKKQIKYIDNYYYE